MRATPKRVCEMLAELPNLAAEVWLTRGAPNPSGERGEKRGRPSPTRTPLDLVAWDALRVDGHGQLVRLTQCVRLVWEEARSEQQTVPPLSNPATWVGECGWLLATEPWWGGKGWRDDIDYDVQQVWAELARAARTPPPLHLTCPRCHFPVHSQANGSYYQCEAGHIIDHFAEVKRMAAIQEMTSAELTEAFGVTDRTLRRWKDAGAVKSCGKRGREPLWSVADVQTARERFGR